MIVIEIIVPLVLLLLLGYFVVEYSLFIPARGGLPILMYHKVATSQPDGLTVTADQFEMHLMYLKAKGYQPITFGQLRTLHHEAAPLPRKAVILTFDDAYRDFREMAVPLLRKYGFMATVFVPVAYIGKTNIWDHGHDPILTAEELKLLTNQGLSEVGLHSFLHRNYKDLAAADMEEDLQNCYNTLDYHAIPFVRVLAYPYGGFPKKDPALKNEMTAIFQKLNLDFAVRIGNRINPYPIRNPYELKRIDIKGTDSFLLFRIKLKKGRAKLFA
jgi:peptidoglycan/xylan/chitin deacetylase (PgdA/CDA1 family)